MLRQRLTHVRMCVKVTVSEHAIFEVVDSNSKVGHVLVVALVLQRHRTLNIHILTLDLKVES